MGGNTGTIPAMPVAAPIQQTGPQRFTTGQRITVQYPQVGSTLTSARGSYVVRDVIGAGEFGAVYDCIGPFDQIYALKMVRPSNRPYRVSPPLREVEKDGDGQSRGRAE